MSRSAEVKRKTRVASGRISSVPSNCFFELTGSWAPSFVSISAIQASLIAYWMPARCITSTSVIQSDWCEM